MNFDKGCFQTPCPKIDCRKKKNACCGLKFVEVPSALTGEMTPENGAFSNAIVRYEETGEVWIYSDEGIPVKITSGQNN